MRPKHPIRPHLYAWRVRLGRSSLWLAERLFRTHTSVLRWERGESGVDDATFDAIAAAYGITPAELSAHPNDAERARMLGQVMNVIRDLDTAQLQLLANTAAALAGKKPAGE